MKLTDNQTARGIYAGLFIGLGAIVYMNVPGIIGAILFALGLMGVVKNNLLLYTGKVGSYLTASVLLNKQTNAFFVKMLLFNAIGIILTTLCVYAGFDSSVMAKTADMIVSTRFSTNIAGLSCGSIGCGMLMSFAVSGFQKKEQGIVPYLNILCAVPVFIMSGFPHCIADLGYYTVYLMSHPFSVGIILSILLGWIISVAGNTLGCLITGDLLGILTETKLSDSDDSEKLKEND